MPVSEVTGGTCEPFGCCTVSAFIVRRSPIDCSFSPIKVEVPNVTGSVLREHNRIGIAQATVEQCDCVELTDGLEDAGFGFLGEWGHELHVYRDCEPDEPVFAGPVTGTLYDDAGNLTVFAADRLAWLGEALLSESIFGQVTVGNAVRRLFEQANSKNCTGIIVDTSRLDDCGEVFEAEFATSDCLTILDYLYDLADLGLISFTMAGTRLYMACGSYDLPVMRVQQNAWTSQNVPIATNGLELATRVCVKSSVSEDENGDSIEPLQVCFPDREEDQVDPFYGCHDHVEVDVPFGDIESLRAAARRIWTQRNRTPRLLDTSSGFSPAAPFCFADLIPGRLAEVDTGGHLAAQLVAQTMSSALLEFTDGRETLVASGFYSNAFGDASVTPRF